MQPIHRDDLVEALVTLIESPLPSFPRGQESSRGVVDAVGPEPLTLRAYLSLLRETMGLSRLRSFAVPGWMLRIAARLGAWFGGFVDRDTLAMLDRGNCAPADTVTQVLGRVPRAVDAFIPSGQRDWLRTRAELDWLLPLLRWMVALTWIATGVVSLVVYPREASLALLARTGLEDGTAVAALYGAGLLDLALGIATLLQRWRRAAYGAQMLLMLAYTAIITVWLPEFWWHPYGPVLKNLPLLAATWLLYRLDDGR